jgi:hypothetical protein
MTQVRITDTNSQQFTSFSNFEDVLNLISQIEGFFYVKDGYDSDIREKCEALDFFARHWLSRIFYW